MGKNLQYLEKDKSLNTSLTYHQLGTSALELTKPSRPPHIFLKNKLINNRPINNKSHKQQIKQQQ